jgi:hypothetical protein
VPAPDDLTQVVADWTSGATRFPVDLFAGCNLYADIDPTRLPPAGDLSDSFGGEPLTQFTIEGMAEGGGVTIDPPVSKEPGIADQDKQVLPSPNVITYADGSTLRYQQENPATTGTSDTEGLLSIKGQPCTISFIVDPDQEIDMVVEHYIRELSNTRIP